MLLNIFRDVLSKKLPTSEAAVERVFSRHKLVQSAQRAWLEPNFVEKVFFLRYNAQRLYPELPIWKSDLEGEPEEISMYVNVFDVNKN